MGVCSRYCEVRTQPVISALLTSECLYVRPGMHVGANYRGPRRGFATVRNRKTSGLEGCVVVVVVVDAAAAFNIIVTIVIILNSDTVHF